VWWVGGGPPPPPPTTPTPNLKDLNPNISMEAGKLQKISVLTFGAGAIGSYIGGSLALAGHKVVFIEQPAVLEELQQQGLRLDLSLDERRETSQPFHLSHPEFICVSSLKEALAQGPYDAAIFALKSFDTSSALEGMKPFIAQMPPVLCLQNGVDNEPALKSVLGSDKVLTGTTTSSVGRLGAGNIVLERLRGVGIATGSNPSLNALAKRMVEAMNEALLNARLFANADDMKWSKMLTNLMGNATAAILDMTPAEVFSHPGLYRLEMGMMREALKVMAAQRIHPVDLPKVPVRLLTLAVRFLPAFIVRPIMVKMVGGGRGAKMPSFHIDLHSGRGKIEVDYLNGVVVRAGQKTGIPTPINRLLNDTLQGMVHAKPPAEDFSRKPEKLLALL
jgi:2-dehydropantoate 2-reductase